MRVVVVSEGCCHPPSSGSRLRTFHLMKRLASRHQITYFCRGLGGTEEARGAEEAFAELGIRAVVVADPPPSQRGPVFYARLAANLFSPLPYSATLHDSARLRQALCEHSRREKVDLWQLEWLPYVEAVHGLAGRKLFCAHDVVAQIWERHHATMAGALKRWYVRQQWRKVRSYEGRMLALADCVVAVSDEDAALIRRLYGIDRLEVVENGVDTRYYAEVEPVAGQPRILYVGALESRPNQDAVRRLLDHIFPAVRRELPEARLRLVGRNPPEWMRRRAAEVAGVELFGSVPDVRPHLAQSTLLAVPLRIGGGSRIKILEALAAGLPVVSTRVGAEGLDLTAGEDLLLVEDEEQMTQTLVDCLRSPARLAALARHGREVVGRRYDWDALADRLERTWLTLAVAPAPLAK